MLRSCFVSWKPAASGSGGSRLVNVHEDVPIPAKQRKVRFSDFENVARLKERGRIRKYSQENWCRLWQQNPAMAVAKSHLSMGWVLETAQGIVGYQGIFPLLYQFGGQTLVAAVGTGLVIEPAYRARCIGLMASFYRQRGVDLFLLTFAAPSVVELSKALHATALISTATTRSFSGSWMPTSLRKRASAGRSSPWEAEW